MRLLYLVLVSLLFLNSHTIAQTVSPLSSPPVTNRGRLPGTPAPRATPTKESAAEQKQRYEDAVAVLEERVGEASDKVMAKIIDQEKDLRMRFNYFQKPERLNPNSFATREEIQPWLKLTDELQQSRDLMAKLYGNASEDLDSALIAQRIAPAVADQIRRELISSFPWDEIAKKDDLLNTYIADHRQLLTLFDQNWAAWKPDKPYFSEAKTESDYEKLCDQITGTGKQIEALYEKMNIQSPSPTPVPKASAHQ